jgi:serine/threonine protein kinase
MAKVKSIELKFSREKTGTPSTANNFQQFMAPEILSQTLKQSESDSQLMESGCATDIYAFGILIACFLTKKSDPFIELRQSWSEMKTKIGFNALIVKGEVKPCIRIESYTGDYLLTLLFYISSRCCSNIIRERPTLLVLHGLLNSLRLMSIVIDQGNDVTPPKLSSTDISSLKVCYEWLEGNPDLERYNLYLRYYGMGLCGRLLAPHDKAFADDWEKHIILGKSAFKKTALR